MVKEFWTTNEMIELFGVEETFITELEEEEVLCPRCHDDPKVHFFNAEEMEKLRIAKLLVEDLGVNLPGVEIILRMRQCMYEMRRQFDDILEDLVKYLQENPTKSR